MQSSGIRAFIGKLSMDQSSRETYVEASTQAALSSAKSFAERCRNIVSSLPVHERLIEPVLTPRFVPTCSDGLLSGLGDLAESSSLRIQSHLAEARDQVDWVKKERGSDDIYVFDKARSSSVLLGPLLIVTGRISSLPRRLYRPIAHFYKMMVSRLYVNAERLWRIVRFRMRIFLRKCFVFAKL